MDQAAHSSGYQRSTRVGREQGALHASVSTCTLDPGGRLDPHLHSFEELVFVLSGSPLLSIGGECFELAPDQAALLGTGEVHAWSNPGGAEAAWVELQAPPARAPGEPPDTVFVAAAEATAASEPEPVDPGDPRRRRFGRWREDGADAPWLALPGMTATMVIDERQGATHAKTFVVDYEPGAVLPAHDHPFEETFYVLEGEVVYTAAGEERLLGAGDVAFAAVGCLHSFENRSGARCCWLESQSPLPPLRNDTRPQQPWSLLAAG